MLFGALPNKLINWTALIVQRSNALYQNRLYKHFFSKENPPFWENYIIKKGLSILNQGKNLLSTPDFFHIFFFAFFSLDNISDTR